MYVIAKTSLPFREVKTYLNQSMEAQTGSIETAWYTDDFVLAVRVLNKIKKETNTKYWEVDIETYNPLKIVDN